MKTDVWKKSIKAILVPFPAEVNIKGKDVEVDALHYIVDNLDKLNV